LVHRSMTYCRNSDIIRYFDSRILDPDRSHAISVLMLNPVLSFPPIKKARQHIDAAGTLLAILFFQLTELVRRASGKR
jgi:hypothetical protein